MKKILSFLALLLTPAAVWATDLTGTQTYSGMITAVAPGYYGQVGVDLADGWTCHGNRQVILQSSNPRYNEILAVLITAQATQQSVKLYAIPSNATFLNGYCTIDEAAIGNFSAW